MANTINFVLNAGAVIVYGQGSYAGYRLSLNCGTTECAPYGTKGIIIFPNSNQKIVRINIADWADITGDISPATFQTVLASLGALLSGHPISITPSDPVSPSELIPYTVPTGGDITIANVMACVVSTTGVIMDSATAADEYIAGGIPVKIAAAGTTGYYMKFGNMTNPNWAWDMTANQNIYLNGTGLSQTAPGSPPAVFMLVVAKVVLPQIISINIQYPQSTG